MYLKKHYIGEVFNGVTVVGETPNSIWVAGTNGDWIMEKREKVGGKITSLITVGKENHKIHKISFDSPDNYYFEINAEIYPDLIIWEFPNEIYATLSTSNYHQPYAKRTNRMPLQNIPQIGDELFFDEIISWGSPKDLCTAESFEEMYHAGEPHNDDDFDNTPYHKGDELAY